DHARLLALASRADGLSRVPDVADDARAHLFRETRPRHEDLAGLIVGGGDAGVRALGQHDALPRPFQDRRVLQPDLALAVLVDRRAVVLALELQDLFPAVLDDHEVVVLRAAPALSLPAVGNA